MQTFSGFRTHLLDIVTLIIIYVYSFIAIRSESIALMLEPITLNPF